jgi:polysaccharide biosynthesis transport protein
MARESFQQPIEQVLKYWQLIIDHKWPILVSTTALMLLFALIIAALPNVYEATTTILVDPQQVPEKYVSPAINSDHYARLNTITQQVLSRSRLQEIIEKLGLYQERRKAEPMEDLIQEMRDDISIQVRQGSGPEMSTFSLTYQGKQPKTVADVANELASSFIRWNVDSREQQVSGTKEFLSTELNAAKRNLEKQEDKVRQFKMTYLGQTPDQTANNLQALAGLRASLQADSEAMNRLDEERILITHAVEPLAAAPTASVNLSERERLEMEKRQLEVKIQQLREHYSDRYPDVVRARRRLADISAQLDSLVTKPDPAQNSPEPTTESARALRLQLIDKEMQRLKAHQDQIQSQIASYQSKVDATPIREQQLVELNRNYEVSRQHYQALLDKSFNVEMAADLEQKQKAERFRVLDRAQIPQTPIKPRRKKLIVLSSVLAFGLALFAVIARDELSPAVKTETELVSLLPAGARIVGFIPRLETSLDARRSRNVAMVASLICILLCLALTRVIWGIRMEL